MIGHLIYAAALNAPDIGDALVKYLAKSMVSAMADEAKSRMTGGLAGLGDTLSAFGVEALASATVNLDNLTPEIQERVKIVLENALREFDLVLIKADDLAELRRKAKAEQ